MDLAERIRRGLKASLVARTIHVSATGLLMVVLARYLLDPNEYGLLFLAIATFGIVQLFANLGIGKSAARYLTEYRETDPGQVPHIVRTSFVYRLGAIGAVCIVFYLIRDPLAGFLDREALVPLFALGVLYLAFHSVMAYAAIAFQGFNRVDWSAAVRAVSSLSRFALVVGFVLLVGGALGALIGYVVSYAIAAVFGLVVLYVKFYSQYEPDEEREPGLGRRIARYSGPIAVIQGAHALDNRVDAVLIGFFMNPTAVGFYYLGKQIVDFLQTPAASLGYAISPSFGEQKAADRMDHAAHLYQQTLEHVLLLYIPAGIGMLLVAEPAIGLVFGADYLGAVPVVQLFSAYLVLQAVTFVTSNGIDYLGRADSRAVAKGATSIANFLLNLLVIPLYGIAGAAAATVLTHSAYVALNLYIVHQEFSLDLERLGRSVATTCLITLGMGLIVFALVPRISGLIELFGVMGLGAAIWATLSVASGKLDLDRVTTVLS